MRRLTDDEFEYVGNQTLLVIGDLDTVWCHATGHITPRSAYEYVGDISDDDLEAACEVPGLMTLEERETCAATNFSTERLQEMSDDSHVSIFQNGELALLQMLNSIQIKAAVFHMIATFKDELAEETSKAA